MPISEYTLLADAVGTPINPPLLGIEVENSVSRRQIDVSEVSYCRMQFASTDTTIECEVQSSRDNGLTWQVMIGRFVRAVPARANQCSDWALVPADLLGQEILVRTMLYGIGTQTRITYLSLQFR